ncbi:MAG: hypothetical protein ACR2MK_07710 [Solirubrobacteraceae bacterium]
MRLRLTVLACALSALACAVTPAVAGAAPRHNHGLTIHAVPHHIIAGEAVLIFGQLKGPNSAGQPIQLYHRINPNPSFSLIGTTKTDSAGRYEFIRQEGVVETNRSWYVRGPGLSHSRTVHERVAALVSLAASTTNGLTRHPITFSGHLTPDHAGSVVLLQAQRDSGDDWTTLKRGVVGPGANYQIAYAWRVAGERNVRVLFPGDRRNTAGASDPVSIVIQQAQQPDFTINTSDAIVPNGSPYTISGTLDQSGPTTPEPNTSVSLFAREPGNTQFHEVASTTTGGNGEYNFANLTSTHNDLYQVRTTFAPARESAVLFEGVQDVVTLTASSSTSTVGGHITFTGNVSPDKSGHVVYLQKFGKDSDWHTVEVQVVHSGSTFQFGWTFGTARTKEFRARIIGGKVNVGGASAPVTIDVTQPPLSSLPTG